MTRYVIIGAGATGAAASHLVPGEVVSPSFPRTGGVVAAGAGPDDLTLTIGTVAGHERVQRMLGAAAPASRGPGIHDLTDPLDVSDVPVLAVSR